MAIYEGIYARNYHARLCSLIFGGTALKYINNMSNDFSVLSSNIETYVRQLKISQQKNPALAAEEARKALVRTGVIWNLSNIVNVQGGVQLDDERCSG